MVKIIIINDNKQLELKGNEKTIEDIKETISTYYGYIRSNILFFLDEECTKQIKDNFNFSNYIDKLTLYMKYNKEEDDDNSSIKSKNDENNNESESDSYPNDLRKVVEQINQKEEKKNKYLNHKRYFEEDEYKPEKYNLNTGKLEKEFVYDKEDLYDILNNKNNIYITKIISEDEMKEKMKNNKNIFNYNEFKKKNKIKEDLLNFEDLLNYLDENTEKGKVKNEKIMKEIKENDDEQNNQNNILNYNNDDDYFYDINKIDDQNNNYDDYIENENLNKKIECGKILKNTFVKGNKKILDINDRKKLKDIIQTLDLENKNYSNINNFEQEKINIILDLDNTIIFSFLDNQKLEPKKVHNKINNFKNFNYHNEQIYTIDISINTNGNIFNVFTFFKFRNGTEEFFKKLKPFCNFYVNSNGAKEYVHTIVQQIEKTFEIKIQKYLYRNEYNKKNFNDFDIDYSKSIIIDDRIDVWQHYYLPRHRLFPSIFLLPSKKYFDNRLLDKSYFSQKNQFKGFHIIVNNRNDWRIPVSYILDDNYFLNKDSIPLNLENENDKKFQLIYLSIVIKKIISLRNFWVYYIEKESNLKTFILINLIRHTIFSNKIFDVKFLFENKSQIGQKNVIQNMIESLGGEVYDPDDIYSNEPTHYLIGLNLTESDKKELQNIKKNNNNKPLFFVNAKYIFDCYYFLTELNENDEEYEIKI